DTSSDLIKDIYKGLTYHSLRHYDAVTAFSDAIKFGEEYTANKRSLPGASIWLNLARAYGKKMFWLREGDKSNQNKEEQSKTRSLTIDAVKQSILLDPTSKTKVGELLKTTDPNENGLGAFKDDDDFKRLVGF